MADDVLGGTFAHVGKTSLFAEGATKQLMDKIPAVEALATNIGRLANAADSRENKQTDTTNLFLCF